MTTMADLVRRECECGTIWYQGIAEPKATECNECFRKKRMHMTTEQINSHINQTPPAEEVNGHAAVEPAAVTPKRTRRPKPGDKQPGKSAVERLRELQEQADELKSTAIEELRAHRLEVLDDLKDTDAELEELGVIIEIEAMAAVLPRKARKIASAKPRSGGKRHRRSAAEIQTAVAEVVSLVKKHKDGLRAEQIRTKLNIDKRELPRLLKEGIKAKHLKSTGHKRSTTYFVR